MELDNRIIRKGEIRDCVILSLLGLLPFIAVFAWTILFWGWGFGD